MFSILLREACGSRLREVIEYATVCAITEFGRQGRKQVACRFKTAAPIYESFLRRVGHLYFYRDLKKRS